MTSIGAEGSRWPTRNQVTVHIMEDQKGLTLIEGLIVGGIIVILLFATGLAVSTSRERVRDYKRISDVSRMQASLELYFSNQNSYPIALEPVVIGDAGSFCLSSSGFSAACPPTGQVFMNPVPSQTSVGLGGADLQVYAYQSDGDTYAISFAVENDISQTNITKGLACAYPGQTIIQSRVGSCPLLSE